MNQRHQLLLTTLATLALTCSAVTQAAETFEDHGRISHAAEAYALDIAVGMLPAIADIRATARLDSRLRLPACPGELESFLPASQSSLPSSIGVRCPGGTAWSIYVPVRVEAVANVLVLAMPGMRGDAVTADQIRLEPRDIARLTSGFLTDIADTDGMVLKRQTRGGMVLTPAMLERERIIRRGERVELRSGGGGLRVSVEGEALADAALGDRVRVRNVASGRIIEGIVKGSGLVAMSQ